MFTGIISHIGTIESTEAKNGLRIRVGGAWPAGLGESIAVNGACLTVVESEGDTFAAELSPETLACTAARWNKGNKVNLERALKMGDSLDGHLVTGHVDGIAKLLSISPDQGSYALELEAPAALARFIAAKGSVTLNGVSLTVNKVNANRFGLTIIPHTWKATSFSTLTPGDGVNLEVDLIARYTERLLQK